MAFTIVTVAEMKFMSGENVDATGDGTANHQLLHDYAVSYLFDLVKFEVLGKWEDITANYKFILSEWAARQAGMQLIFFNTIAYRDRVEAEDMVNIHLARMKAIEDLLNKADVQDFMGV